VCANIRVHIYILKYVCIYKRGTPIWKPLTITREYAGTGSSHIQKHRCIQHTQAAIPRLSRHQYRQMKAAVRMCTCQWCHDTEQLYHAWRVYIHMSMICKLVSNLLNVCAKAHTYTRTRTHAHTNRRTNKITHTTCARAYAHTCKFPMLPFSCAIVTCNSHLSWLICHHGKCAVSLAVRKGIVSLWSFSPVDQCEEVYMRTSLLRDSTSSLYKHGKHISCFWTLSATEISNESIKIIALTRVVSTETCGRRVLQPAHGALIRHYTTLQWVSPSMLRTHYNPLAYTPAPPLTENDDERQHSGATWMEKRITRKKATWIVCFMPNLLHSLLDSSRAVFVKKPINPRHWENSDNPLQGIGPEFFFGPWFGPTLMARGSVGAMRLAAARPRDQWMGRH